MEWYSYLQQMAWAIGVAGMAWVVGMVPEKEEIKVVVPALSRSQQLPHRHHRKTQNDLVVLQAHNKEEAMTKLMKKNTRHLPPTHYTRVDVAMRGIIT